MHITIFGKHRSSYCECIFVRSICILILFHFNIMNVEDKPRLSINKDGICWLNAAMKLLAYNDQLITWFSHCVKFHENMKNHDCIGICSNIFDTVKSMLILEHIPFICIKEQYLLKMPLCD